MHECAICLDSIYPAKYKLPCKHLFHVKCIKKWLKHSQSCPVCRYVIISQFLTYRHRFLKPRVPVYIKANEDSLFIKEFSKKHKMINYKTISSVSIKEKMKKNIIIIKINKKNKKKHSTYKFVIESKELAKKLLENINSKIHNSDFHNMMIMQMHTEQALIY